MLGCLCAIFEDLLQIGQSLGDVEMVISDEKAVCHTHRPCSIECELAVIAHDLGGHLVVFQNREVLAIANAQVIRSA